MTKTIAATVIGLMLVTLNVHALELQIAPSKYAQKIQQLSNDVQKILPAKMRRAFSDVKIKVTIAPGHKDIAGSAFGKSMWINSTLLENLNATSKPTNSSLGTAASLRSAEQTLQATFIHELAHIYDRLNIQEDSFKKEYRACMAKKNAGPPRDREASEPACLTILKTTTSISTRLDFLELSYFRDLQRRNYLETRSPDPYEFENSKESFAVNFEYFLLDSEYQCRRPELYQFFVNYFEGYTPFTKSECEATNTLLVIKEDKTGSSAQFEEVDADRVYQIHYLHASKGADIPSRFGHSMLRLIICAPHRAEAGPDCLKDVAYHRVISFRANVYGSVLDYRKALNGGYDSNLFVLDFLSILDEYTKSELRDLYSYPLNLSAAQKSQMLNAIISSHWQYRGRYKFITNNCSHETLSLLKRALFSAKSLQRAIITTPNSLEDKLIEIRLADKSVFNDLQEATKKGFFFASKRHFYDKAITALVDAGLLSKKIEVEQYLELAPTSRTAFVNRVSAETYKSQKAVAALLLLEDLALVRAKSDLQKKIAEYINDLAKDQNKSSTAVELEKNFKTTIEIANYYGNPSGFLTKNATYGLPSSKEFLDISGNMNMQQILASGEAANNYLKDSYQKLSLGKERTELEFTQDLVEKLKTKLLKPK